MDVEKLKLAHRTVTGKKVKQLRKEGWVPVHVYGSGTDPMNLQSEALILRRVLPRVGMNIPLSIDIEGRDGDNICFVREVQRHPVTEDVMHVDFLRVDVSEEIQTDVPVNLIGEAPSVREMNGTLLQSLQTVLVESLPMNVPAYLEIDVSALDDFEKSLTAGDLSLPGNVTLLTDPSEMLARVLPPRIEVEEEPVLEEGEELEGEAIEDGEAEEESGDEPEE